MSANRWLLLPLSLCCLLLLPVLSLAYDTTERVSVSSAGEQANNSSEYSSISGDGRYVAFESDASNLVEGDTNGVGDVFVRDRLLGTTERVSVSLVGEVGNADSREPCISPDGRYLAFCSGASNLVAGDTNNRMDVFVRDQLTGEIERVSLSSAGAEGNDGSYHPSISADGRYVAFYSYATNLVAGDVNAATDIFVRDRLLGTTELVSVTFTQGPGNPGSSSPSISADGRYVAFDSAGSKLVVGDCNMVCDVFVRDRELGITERVSLSSAEEEGDAESHHSSISADGRYVAFWSRAGNLVEGDSNGCDDIFVRDRVTGDTERVSLSSTEVQGNWHSGYPRITADGRYVAFYSEATNLVAGDTNSIGDVFVRDRLAGDTERVSVSSTGAEGNYGGAYPSISADGRYVAFLSDATDLVPGDTNVSVDAFVRGPALAPQVLLEVHPNERGQGPPTTSLNTGDRFWLWPTPSGSGAYTWKTYKFGGSASLWIQVCAQNYAAFQNKPNNGFGNQDTLMLVVDGAVTPTDVWGIQSGPPGNYQWKGDVDQGKRVELEFLVTGLTPGIHTLRLSASMCPIIYWLKVYDLELRYAEQ